MVLGASTTAFNNLAFAWREVAQATAITSADHEANVEPGGACLQVGGDKDPAHRSGDTWRLKPRGLLLRLACARGLSPSRTPPISLGLYTMFRDLSVCLRCAGVRRWEAYAAPAIDGSPGCRLITSLALAKSTVLASRHLCGKRELLARLLPT